MMKNCTSLYLATIAASGQLFLLAGSSYARARNQPERKSSKPNIIFVFSDDLSYRDLSCYGQDKFTTPNLDKLALNGLRFRNAYAGSPECAPSRASLMTGMHMGHCRIRANRSVRGQDHLLAEDITVAEVLKKAGYTTGFIGKWGIGLPGTEGMPDKQGFDHAFGYYDQRRAHGYFPHYLMVNGMTMAIPENYGFNMGRLYDYNSRPVEEIEGVKNKYDRNGRLIPDGVSDPLRAKYSGDLFQQDALDFIEKNKEGPFFLYYATQIPHGPCIIPDLGEYRDRPWSLKHREWAAMISYMDRGVGKMVELLENLDILENTVIFFAGDNGYSQWGYFGRLAWDNDPVFHNKGPWPRGKFTCTHEGGLRVPFFVYWKDRIRAGQTNHLCSLYDFPATAAELAGTHAPPTDGISFVPVLFGEPGKQKRHRYLYFENGTRSRHAQSDRMGNWWAYRPHPSSPVELYDIRKDTACTQDLAGKNPQLTGQIKQIFRDAHVDSDWYVNPGESEETAKAKKEKYEDAGQIQYSTGPNQTYIHLNYYRGKTKDPPPADPGAFLLFIGPDSHDLKKTGFMLVNGENNQ